MNYYVIISHSYSNQHEYISSSIHQCESLRKAIKQHFTENVNFAEEPLGVYQVRVMQRFKTSVDIYTAIIENEQVYLTRDYNSSLALIEPRSYKNLTVKLQQPGKRATQT
jgi:hypothetical protein